MKTILYFISLALLIAGIVIVVEYPDSERLQIFSGTFILFGIVLNVVAFLLRRKNNQ